MGVRLGGRVVAGVATIVMGACALGAAPATAGLLPAPPDAQAAAPLTCAPGELPLRPTCAVTAGAASVTCGPDAGDHRPAGLPLCTLTAQDHGTLACGSFNEIRGNATAEGCKWDLVADGGTTTGECVQRQGGPPATGCDVVLTGGGATVDALCGHRPVNLFGNGFTGCDATLVGADGSRTRVRCGVATEGYAQQPPACGPRD